MRPHVAHAAAAQPLLGHTCQQRANQGAELGRGLARHRRLDVERHMACVEIKLVLG